MLVLHGMLNPGALVSFMLYQQQLTSCFSAIGDVFTAITTALGAAEKVRPIYLIHTPLYSYLDPLYTYVGACVYVCRPLYTRACTPLDS